MITKLSNLKKLPYKAYIAVLLKDESRIDKANEIGIEGYSYITSTPKMVMLFIEYIEGMPHKVDKNIWNLL